MNFLIKETLTNVDQNTYVKVTNNSEAIVWQWFDSDAPESTEMPDGYSSRLAPFELLMALRCFRVDRIYRALTDYITVTMGEDYITPPVIRLSHCLEVKLIYACLGSKLVNA